MKTAIAIKSPSAHRIGCLEAWLSRPRNWIGCVFAVLALQTVLVVMHDPWLDEWQALQISLQSPTFGALFENLRYEGHPPTWYLLLRGAGSILPPRWILAAVQLPIAIAIQVLILFRLPLQRVERLLLACNPYVLIDYGAISRSLGLGVLLLLAAVLFRHRRGAWLAIAALPMMDFLFGVLSLAWIAFLWREKRIWTPGLALWLLSGLAAAWSVRPAPDMIPAFWLNGPLHDSLVEISRFGALLLPVAIADGHVVWNEAPPIAAALVGGILFIGMGLWLLRRDRFALAVFGGFVGLILLFSVFVYPLAIRHVSLATVLLILLYSMVRGREAAEERTLRVWLGLGACCGLVFASATLARPFDTARSAAAFILEHHLENKHWASFPDSRAQGVSALTGTEFERLERNCTETFVRWNYRSRIKWPWDLERELKRISDRSGTFYLLTDFDLLRVQTVYPGAYRQLAFIPEGVDGQQFYLYQVRPDLPAKQETLPKCAPDRRPLRVLNGQALRAAL